MELGGTALRRVCFKPNDVQLVHLLFVAMAY